jgi:Glycosyl transferase family 2
MPDRFLSRCRSMISVSVIIPAYNAADTLAQTIDALLAQTYPHWEAIVVDDGSTDDTARIAQDFAAQDDRIHLISQPNGNVCVARNTGIRAARFHWLLFNDADDWIAPTHLEKMTAVLAGDETLDAVHCGWQRVAIDGTIGPVKYAPDYSDMFSELARYCTFHVNTCIVRKILVEAVGGFDVRVLSCEDWDLWQRIARMDVKFGAVSETLSFYRMRPNSRSGVSQRFTKAGLQVLTTGHQADSRVTNPHPDHAMGLSPEALIPRQFYFLTWGAGLVLGRGQDARSLLALVESDCPSVLEPWWIAANLFETLPASQVNSDWVEIYPQILPVMTDFLQALAERLGMSDLVKDVLGFLEWKILWALSLRLPMTIGDSHGACLDITQTIPDIISNADRLCCFVNIAGESLGEIELSIVSGQVSAVVLADVIAGEYFWWILGRFFQCDDDARQWERFLQELFNQPGRDSAWFYSLESNQSEYLYLAHPVCQIEISQDLPAIQLNFEAETISVILTVGGQALGVMLVPVADRQVSTGMLRSTLLHQSGLELCRLCVRAAIIGQPLQTGENLRTRLQRLAAQVCEPIDITTLPPIGSCWRPA